MSLACCMQISIKWFPSLWNCLALPLADRCDSLSIGSRTGKCAWLMSAVWMAVRFIYCSLLWGVFGWVCFCRPTSAWICECRCFCSRVWACECACVCVWAWMGRVCLRQTHFSSLCKSLLAQQGLVDRSLFLLQQFSIDWTSVNSDRPSKKLVAPYFQFANGETWEMWCCIFRGKWRKKHT